MPDFSLLQQPNFASAALSGFQAGSAIGKQRQLDTAMAGINLERPETLLPILRADPSTGAALIGASVKLHAEKREQVALGAKSAYIKERLGMGPLSGGSPTPAATALPPEQPATPPAMTSATPSAAPPNGPTADGADIVVTAPSPHADPEAARRALIDADPDGYAEMQTKIDGMNKVQREQLDAANNTFGAAIEATKTLPYEQRRGYIAAQRQQLIDHGVPAQQVDAFDPTDGNIVGIENQVLGVKGTLEQLDKNRQFGLEQDRFGETQRHARVEEGQGAARIGLEGANVGIARGHLALAQRADARAGAKAASAPAATSSIPSPTSRAAYAALSSGTHYRAPDGSIRIK